MNDNSMHRIPRLAPRKRPRLLIDPVGGITELIDVEFDELHDFEIAAAAAAFAAVAVIRITRGGDRVPRVVRLEGAR